MEFKIKLMIGLWCFVLVYAQIRTIPGYNISVLCIIYVAK